MLGYVVHLAPPRGYAAAGDHASAVARGARRRPWLVLIVFTVISIVVLVRRRLAFWIPLLGGALIIGSLVLGWTIAAAGVPTS